MPLSLGQVRPVAAFVQVVRPQSATPRNRPYTKDEK